MMYKPKIGLVRKKGINLVGLYMVRGRLTSSMYKLVRYWLADELVYTLVTGGLEYGIAYVVYTLLVS